MAKPKAEFGQNNPHDQLMVTRMSLAGWLLNMKSGIYNREAEIKALERAVEDIKLLVPYLKGIEW